MPSTQDAVETLYQQAAQVIGSGAGKGTTEHVAAAAQSLHTFAQYGETIAFGLFPLAAALLIFHENYQASMGEGRPFRIGYVLGRIVTIAALLHPWTYGRLCALITYAAGAQGGWLSFGSLLDAGKDSLTGLQKAFGDLTGDDPGISDYARSLFLMLPLIGLWLLLIGSVLLAYIAGLLLSLSQAVLLSILLAVGKTCITVSLVPGVGVAGSWARSLAKVAAWSTIAGIVTGLMLHALPNVKGIVAMMAYGQMMRVTGQFVVLAICTFSVPSITERIFSGAAPHGNAALEAVGAAWLGARGIARGGRAARGAKRAQEAAGSGHPGTPGGPGSFGDSRPHKVSPSRLREGLAAVGSLAAAPFALAAARLAGREPPLSLNHLPARSAAKLALRNQKRAQRGLPPTLAAHMPGYQRARAMHRPDAPPDAPENAPAREAELIESQLARVHSNGGARPEFFQKEALNHVSKAGVSFRDWKTLRKAYPDLKFNPDKLKPVEKQILGVLDFHKARYGGWRDGAQGLGDFAEARELATYQLQAQRSPVSGGSGFPALASGSGAAPANRTRPATAPEEPPPSVRT